MSSEKHLLFSILEFLNQKQGSVSEEEAESLEVAQQCLETVFNIGLQSVELKQDKSLLQIFQDGTSVNDSECPIDKEAAEKHKCRGNEMMKEEIFNEALNCYNQAIKHDSKNAVYYCNRAAAHSKLNNNEKALEDCIKALKIDPNYSKAYGRKGLAHSALNQHKEALACYEKALEFDQSNQSYIQNIAIAKQKLEETETQGSFSAETHGIPTGIPGMPGGMPGPGMPGPGMPAGIPDLSSILENPALMNMATSLMGNPQMQSFMTSMMGSAPPQEGDGSNAPGGMADFLVAGQRLAQQMQQSNPELVEQLRRQTNNGQDPPPPPST